MDRSRTLTAIERYYAAVVAANAQIAFGGAVEAARLRSLAAEAVVDLLGGRTTLAEYVPELALRAVRDAIEGRRFDLVTEHRAA